MGVMLDRRCVHLGLRGLRGHPENDINQERFLLMQDEAERLRSFTEKSHRCPFVCVF